MNSTKSQSNKSNNERKRLNIGFFINWVGPGYQMQLINGIKETLKKYDANLICFEGSYITNENTEINNNPIYNLACRENCDGLIFASSVISKFIKKDIYSNFCSKYKEIPIVSIGAIVDNIPSITIDNNLGITELVSHLVVFHGYKEFACIKGPEFNFDANERFQSIISALEKHSISIKNENIISGDFTYHSGMDGISKLLENSHKKIDAVIITNDAMAYGAIEELTKRGINVPGEIAVTGFDNITYPGTTSPSLTTVNQAIYQQAEKAVSSLMDMINKGHPGKNFIFPSNLVIKETCGCLSQNVLETNANGHKNNGKNIKTALTNDKNKIINAVIKNIEKENDAGKYKKILEELINHLYKQLFDNDTNSFLKILHNLLHISLHQREEMSIWDNIISQLRYSIIPYVNDNEKMIELENIFHQGRIMISEKKIVSEQNIFFSTILDNELITIFRDEMQETYDINKQFEIITGKTQKIGIKSCFIILNMKEIMSNEGLYGNLIYAYYNNQRQIIDDKTCIFPIKILLPDNLLNENQNFFFLVSPIGYGTEQIGYIILEFDELKGELYGNLKRIIINSIQESILFKKIKDQADNLQIQKQELSRTITTLRKTMSGFIQTLSLTIETRDPYTAGHQRRTSDLARAIATEMGLPHDMIEGIRMAGIIHDLGKIYIPGEILNKPGKLLDIEFELIKAHPQIAYDILKTIEFPWPIADIVLQHHEKLDGSGYPLGLKEDEIKIEACILCVADVVEAMASYRPYRPALGVDIALEEITKFRGIRYKKEVVDACLNIFINKDFHFRK
jgi:HD-GYP domain-containing protein (c-di-GMP phosphodiesterase class II)/DNA-binding LacI/PurR family transcriptional regulator